MLAIKSFAGVTSEASVLQPQGMPTKYNKAAPFGQKKESISGP